MDQPKSRDYFEFVRDLQNTLKSFRKKQTETRQTKQVKTIKVINSSKDDNVYYFGQRSSLKNLK